MSGEPLRVVGLGGSLTPSSTAERLVSLVLQQANAYVAETELFSNNALDLPYYRPGIELCPKARRLIEALRSADAVVLGTPSYHGGISGLVKNAIDYVEELSTDSRPYLDGRPVVCVAAGGGYQGAWAALSSLRDITHALRGWPTPLGLAVSTSMPIFSKEGMPNDTGLVDKCRIAAAQMIEFVVTKRSFAETVYR